MNLDPYTTFGPPTDPAPYIQLILRRDTYYFRWSDLEAAEQFARLHLHSICCRGEKREWLCWNGKRWERDAVEKIRKAIENFLVIYGEAALTSIGGKAGAREQLRVNGVGYRNAVWSCFRVKQEFYQRAFPGSMP